MIPIDRRSLLAGASAGAALVALRGRRAVAAAPTPTPSGMAPVYAQIDKRLDESVARIQKWIKQPSVSTQNLGIDECCQLTMDFLKDAGFQMVRKMPTDRHPGIFATLDAGAKRTLALYFMYDVQPVEEKEWSSPPWQAALVDKPGVGKVIMGRGAVNQKGPEGAFLAALHAVHGAGRKLPVNLVLVAEGEEELGSPHLSQVVYHPDVQAALARSQGVLMPSASQDLAGDVEIALGAKGIVYLELEASGKAWGRGPREQEIHSSLKAVVDSPTWRLVQALATLVSADGNQPAIDGLMDAARKPTRAETALLDQEARRRDEAAMKQALKVDRWIDDMPARAMFERLQFQPSVNIDGLVSGYGGPGVKTILPHRALAKIDVRLVPDMMAKDVVAKIRAHLDKRGYQDIELRVLAGYEPTQTAPDAAPVKTMIAVYKKAGIDPVVVVRGAGSWPGYLFTGKPTERPAIHYGLGHGSGAHSKDEYYVVEPAPGKKFQGLAGAVRSFADFLYGFAA
jgi:acetylornithine deacetylase/succinyl-diaminopimelate desuccinylase-like protein